MTKPTTAALAVACPICDAQPGRPCRTDVGASTGRLTREVRLTHGYRAQVAEEVSR